MPKWEKPLRGTHVAFHADKFAFILQEGPLEVRRLGNEMIRLMCPQRVFISLPGYFLSQALIEFSVIDGIGGPASLQAKIDGRHIPLYNS